MRKTRTFLAVATMAISGLGFTRHLGAEEAKTQVDVGSGNARATADAGSRDNSTADVNPQLRGIRELFARSTEDAATVGGINSLTNRFSRADRDRLNASGHAAGADENSTNSRPDRSANTRQDKVTGSAADQKGTSDRIGGRDIPGGARVRDTHSRDVASGDKPVDANAPGSASSDDSSEVRQLNDSVSQFRKDWKAKYGRDFRITDPRVVYSDLHASDISGGTAQTASDRIRGDAGSDSSTSDRSANTRQDKVTGSAADQKGTSDRIGGRDIPGGQRVRDTQSRDVASGDKPVDADSSSGTSANAAGQRMHAEPLLVTAPAVHGAPAVDVRVVREGGTYRFDVPDTLDRRTLANNLRHHIDEVDQQKADWPSDANEAERLVTQHVLMAIADMNGKAVPAGSRITPEGRPADRAPGDTTPKSDASGHFESTGASNTQK